MLTIKKPNASDTRDFLAAARKAPFTYDQIGATQFEQTPAGFVHDASEVLLGKGRSVFDAGKKAFQDFAMFPSSMLELITPSAKIAAGEVVAIRIRLPLTWAMCACRIVYTIDERSESARFHRFGFGYGTLNGHVESGEERFLIEWDRKTSDVRYSIFVFSQPAQWIVRLGYPYTRYMQNRFRQLSMNSVATAVRSYTTDRFGFVPSAETGSRNASDEQTISVE